MLSLANDIATPFSPHYADISCRFRCWCCHYAKRRQLSPAAAFRHAIAIIDIISCRLLPPLPLFAVAFHYAIIARYFRALMPGCFHVFIAIVNIASTAVHIAITFRCSAERHAAIILIRCFRHCWPHFRRWYFRHFSPAFAIAATFSTVAAITLFAFADSFEFCHYATLLTRYVTPFSFRCPPHRCGHMLICYTPHIYVIDAAATYTCWYICHEHCYYLIYIES